MKVSDIVIRCGWLTAELHSGDSTPMSDDSPGTTLSRPLHLRRPSRHARLPGRQLLDFLRHHEADTIYLVGDIVDGWRAAQSTWYWPQTHNDVVQKLLRKARKGARRDLHPRQSRRIPARLFRHAFRRHRGRRERDPRRPPTARRYLVIHGDMFDLVVQHARWLALSATRPTTWRCGSTWSSTRCAGGSACPTGRCRNGLKHKVKNAVELHRRLREDAGAEAQRRGVDGVICGHIHIADDPRRPTASATSTTATGSKAAPRSSSTTTAASRSSTWTRRV